MVKILEVGSKLRVLVGQQLPPDTPNRSWPGGGKGSGTNNYYGKGFTLTEMMVTLAIASILITVAVSNLRETARDNRLTAQINTFVSSLQFVRSEAIKRGVFVTIRKGRDEDSDDVWNGEWEDGWEIFTDNPVIGVIDGADQQLRVGAALPNNFMFRSNFNISNFISYRPNGRSRGNSGLGTGSLVLCDASDGNTIPESRTARMITVIGTGRVRIAEHSSNGIPKKSGGGEITSCLSPF